MQQIAFRYAQKIAQCKIEELPHDNLLNPYRMEDENERFLTKKVSLLIWPP